MTRPSLSRTQCVRLFNLHKGICHICGEKIQGGYEGWEIEHKVAWGLTRDDSDENRMPAHRACHKPKTKQDVKDIARAKRREANQMGARKKSKNPMPGSRESGIRKRMDGTVEKW